MMLSVPHDGLRRNADEKKLEINQVASSSFLFVEYKK